MRQLVYIVLDVSGSMFGEPIQSMLNGVDGLVSALQSSSEVDIDNTVVSVITFSTVAKVVARALPLKDFAMPEISVGAEKHFLAQLTSPRRVFDLTINPKYGAVLAPIVESVKGEN